MSATELLILLPPALALVAAWLGARAIRRGAAEIDRKRAALKHDHRPAGARPR